MVGGGNLNIPESLIEYLDNCELNEIIIEFVESCELWNVSNCTPRLNKK